MPATIYHVKTQTVADVTATSLIRPSDWNSAHAVTLSPTGQEIIGAFSNGGNVTFGTNTAGYVTATAPAGGPGGGGVAVSAGTNSTSTGTVVFSNANGMTFGMDTNGAITGSYTVPSQTVQPVAYSAANGSANFSTLTFANSNGVSFSTGTQGLYATVATNYQSQGAYLTTARASNDAVGLNTAVSNVTATINSSGLSLDARGYAGTGTTLAGANVSFSATLNSNGLNLSGSVSPGGAGDGYNSAQFTNSTANSTMPLLWAGNSNGSGNVTIGLTGSTITMSASGGGGGAAISAGANSQNTGTIIFSNANGVSFGLNAGTMTASHNGLTSQSSQSAIEGFGAGTMGNTAGNTGLSTGIDVYLAGSGSLTISASTIAGSNVLWVQHPAWITTAAQSNGVVLSNAGTNITGNLSVTLGSNAVSFNNGAAGTGTTLNGTNVGISATVNTQGIRLDINNTDDHIKGWSLYGNTAGTTNSQYTTTGGLYLAGGNNITVSGNSNSITISAAALGGTVPFTTVKSNFLPTAYGILASYGTIATAASASIQFQQLQAPMSITRVDIPLVIGSVATAGNNSSAGFNFSASYVIATRNGSTLSSLSSSLLTCFASWNSNTTGSITGTKLMTCPWNLTLPPGDYYHILYTSYAGTGGGLTGANTTSLSASFSQLTYVGGLTAAWAPLGAGTASSTGSIWGVGLCSSTAQLSNLSISNISHTGTNQPRAMFAVNMYG